MRCPKSVKAAFTVGELLVVVAIFALLAAVTGLNFREAVTSTQIAQARSDFRAIKSGLELYKVDHGAYIWMNNGNYAFLPEGRSGASWKPTLERLTTPVSYLDGAVPFNDPFDAIGTNRISNLDLIITPASESDAKALDHYFYTVRDSMQSVHWDDRSTPSWYLLQASGPDRVYTYVGTEMNSFLSADNSSTRAVFYNVIYDATNGTTSKGGIWDVGGTPEGRGVVFPHVINEANSSRVHDWTQQED